MWLGASIHSGDRAFYVPEDYPLDAAGCGIDETGRKFIRVKGVRWFTNLDMKQRHEEMILVKRYNAEDYPRYLNYDAIEVGVTSEIPCDYPDLMGVPITFMDKYNPDQFEIVGISERDSPLRTRVFTKEEYSNYSDLNRCGALMQVDGTIKSTYMRIFIRNKHPEEPKGAVSNAD